MTDFLLAVFAVECAALIVWGMCRKMRGGKSRSKWFDDIRESS